MRGDNLLRIDPRLLSDLELSARSLGVRSHTEVAAFNAATFADPEASLSIKGEVFELKLSVGRQRRSLAIATRLLITTVPIGFAGRVLFTLISAALRGCASDLATITPAWLYALAYYAKVFTVLRLPRVNRAALLALWRNFLRLRDSCRVLRRPWFLRAWLVILLHSGKRRIGNANNPEKSDGHADNEQRGHTPHGSVSQARLIQCARCRKLGYRWHR
jgi:hypothetical protein